MLEDTQSRACRACGESYETPPGSRSTLCPNCRAAVVAETVRQLRAKSEPIYEKWRARYLASKSYRK